MMTLRRHIAFAAILVASTVMFAHAVVPHHHRALDLGVCTEAPQAACHHTAAGEGVYLFDVDCNCGCSGVKCSPTLPFALRFGADTADKLSFSHPDGGMALPLFICDNCTDAHHYLTSPALFATGLHGGFFMTHARLLAQYVPGATAGRAPPVL